MVLGYDLLDTYKIFLLVATINAYVISIGYIATGHTLIESLLVGTGATAQASLVAAGSLIDAAIRTLLGANCKRESVNHLSIYTYIYSTLTFLTPFAVPAIAFTVILLADSNLIAIRAIPTNLLRTVTRTLGTLFLITIVL